LRILKYISKLILNISTKSITSYLTILAQILNFTLRNYYRLYKEWFWWEI